MNIPNEVGSWDADFSYSYLQRLYGRLQRDFDLYCIGEYRRAISSSGRPRALIRHDVDVSLDRALRLAEQEASWGVAATYHVMIDSPLYELGSTRSIAAIHEIKKLGHEIGLHYDVVARNTAAVDAAVRAHDIDDACRILEKILNGPVYSMSFHRPIPEVIRGPLHIAGRVSANGAGLCQWYLSDSRARWREGNPLDGLDRPRADILQILIHPIWWAQVHARPDERLREFLLELSPDPTAQRYEDLRAAVWDQILYRAADLY